MTKIVFVLQPCYNIVTFLNTTFLNGGKPSLRSFPVSVFSPLMNSCSISLDVFAISNTYLQIPNIKPITEK